MVCTGKIQPVALVIGSTSAAAGRGAPTTADVDQGEKPVERPYIKKHLPKLSAPQQLLMLSQQLRVLSVAAPAGETVCYRCRDSNRAKTEQQQDLKS